MALQAFIDDGYTRDGYVKGVEGLHPGLKFKFRPALHQSRLAFAAAEVNGAGDGDAYAKRARELMAKHVVSWDAPPAFDCKKESSWAKLHPDIFKKALDQVLGYNAPDSPIPAEQEAADSKN